MPLCAVGRTLEEIETPALLLDLDAFEHNVRLMAGRFRAHGVGWRPHAKAFKSPAIGHALLRAGAFGLTVAKVSEAEVMAAAGIRDILIAHLVVGAARAARLAALQRQADVRATVDHPDQLAHLAEAARAIGVEVGLLVEINVGLDRSGVADPEAAVELARRVAATPGLRFDGLMGYEGHTLMIPDPIAKRRAITDSLAILLRARDAVIAAGLPCPIVSAGGSGSYPITAEIAGITEIQAGGGVFACLYYTEKCGVPDHRPALSVLATIVSRPTPERVILNAGRKALSDYQCTPILPKYPDSRVLNLSAEHATVAVPAATELRIGTKLEVIPGYSDLTFVLHDRVLGHRGGRVEAVWPLWARGMLQ